MMTIDKFNFAGKKAIVRVDFNVPLNEEGRKAHGQHPGPDLFQFYPPFPSRIITSVEEMTIRLKKTTIEM